MNTARSFEEIQICNVSIHNLSRQELLQNLSHGIVFTPNVDHIIRLRKDESFSEAYLSADYRVCDSKILLYAAKFLGKPLKEKISGSDLLPAFYEFHRNNDEIKIFLLGALEGVAKKAQETINLKVGRNIVVGAHSPSFGFENNDEECQNIVDLINSSGATVLAIGVGAPKQEKWILAHREQLKNIKIFLAIGAAIDFEAHHKKRAPLWMSELGIEWLYRLASEPRRLWRRYLLEDTYFLILLLKEKFQSYRFSTVPRLVETHVRSANTQDNFP